MAASSLELKRTAFCSYVTGFRWPLHTRLLMIRSRPMALSKTSDSNLIGFRRIFFVSVYQGIRMPSS